MAIKLKNILENTIVSKLNKIDNPILSKIKLKEAEGLSKKEMIQDMDEIISETGISESAVKQMTQMLTKMPDEDVRAIYSQFREHSLSTYLNGGFATFEKFFEVKGTMTGTGRGELMAVMAIKDSMSGGTEQKDLSINGKIYEVKEGPDTIRMAKSGFAGLFEYVDEIKSFYKLLTVLNVNNSKNDKNLLDNLNKAFNDETSAKRLLSILQSNFRGDGYNSKGDENDEDIEDVSKENFFYRTKVAAELPPSVIQLHYDGFKALSELKSKVLTNSDLLKNAKMVVKFKDETPAEYWISSEDAEELKTAKVNSNIEITKGEPTSDDDFKAFMYNLIEIFNHSYTKTPELISKHFSDRKREYFSEIEGILCYEKNDPTPFLATADMFIVSGISQNMGKMRRRKKGDSKFQWIEKQT